MTNLNPARTYNSPRMAARHASILAAARAGLTEKGFNGVTMQELADRAGVTKKTLYNVFGNKDDLLFAAVAEVVDDYRESGSHSEPGIMAIVASRDAALDQVAGAPDYANAMTATLMQVDDDHPLVRMLLRDSVAFNEEQLRLEEARGGLRDDCNPTAVAEQITGQAWGCIVLFYKGVLSLEQFQKQSRLGLLLVLREVARGEARDRMSDQIERLMKEQERR